jgi:hypothetical protein
MSKSKEVALAKNIELPIEAYVKDIADDGAYHFPIKSSYFQEENSKITRKVGWVGIPPGVIIGVSSFPIAFMSGIDFIVPIMYFGGAGLSVLGSILAGKHFRKKPQLELEKSYEILNSSLIEWMEKEYNLTISSKTAYGLNRFYFENIKESDYQYPHFEDDKGDRYKLIENPFKDNGAKIVVAEDYENKVQEQIALATKLAKEKFVAEITPATVVSIPSAKYDFTKTQQKLYDTIKTRRSILNGFVLDTEDKYEFEHIINELDTVLQLHSSALSLQLPTYDSQKLDNLLTRFASALEHLTQKQMDKIHNQLEVHQTIGTSK